MYMLARLLLISAIAVTCYCIVIVAMRFGGLVYLAIPVIILAFANRRKGGVYTAHGTARWATLGDLQYAGMVGARRGPIIGKVVSNTKTPVRKALDELFSFSVSSKEACEQFFDSIRFFNRPQRSSELVRLPNAVHTAVFAPTGVGKGVSCVIPYLLTSNESSVVVDVKGENFHLTAEHQAEGIRPSDRRTRPVQIGYAGSSDIQPIGLHRQGFANGSR